jgi:hypothetical protein
VPLPFSGSTARVSLIMDMCGGGERRIIYVRDGGMCRRMVGMTEAAVHLSVQPWSWLDMSTGRPGSGRVEDSRLESGRVEDVSTRVGSGRNPGRDSGRPGLAC